MMESGRVPGKVESVRVTKSCPHQYRERVDSVGVQKNDRIWACTGKRWNSYEYPKTVPTRTGKWSNLREYRKTIESRRVRGKCRNRASVKNLSQLVPEKGRNYGSTEKW